MSETLTDRAIAAYRDAVKRYREQEEEAKERERLQHRESFYIALKRMFDLAVDRNRTWEQNAEQWPGEWIEEPAVPGSDRPDSLVWLHDGLSFRINPWDRHSVLSVRLPCCRCGNNTWAEFVTLDGLGALLLRQDPDVPVCSACYALEADARRSTLDPITEPQTLGTDEALLFALEAYLEERNS